MEFNPRDGSERYCQRPENLTRRQFMRAMSGGFLSSGLFSGTVPLSLSPGFCFHNEREPCAAESFSDLFWIKNIPDESLLLEGDGNHHKGVERLLRVMGSHGLKFYRSTRVSAISGPGGMVQAGDVVLIKVNAQWKYRGCTNSDLIRGLIQRILDHPDGFHGEVVIFENGQGRGSLKCDTTHSQYPDDEVHANANDDTHSFVYLVDSLFEEDSRVSYYLLDPIRENFIGGDDHVNDGYRKYENVSYPCFTTTGGYRVELREGLWDGSDYSQNLKLINVPVLKHHDVGGSEITISLKHFYGVVTMRDGMGAFRHYEGLGETCGKMIAFVRTPVLNIVDAIWTSHLSLSGYPEETTFRTNQLLASQDPVALDYCAAKYILYSIDKNPRHHPDFSGIQKWLTDARDTINNLGGVFDPDAGIWVKWVTDDETKMRIFTNAKTLPWLHLLLSD